MLKKLAMFNNIQPQLQPHLPRAIVMASRAFKRLWIQHDLPSRQPQGSRGSEENHEARTRSDHAKYVV
jgi:hypothetical protein